MSIKEVQLTERSIQTGLMLSLAYDNLQLITNELALHHNNDTNKTESLSFDTNGNIKRNLGSRVMDFGIDYLSEDEKAIMQAAWIHNEQTGKDTTVLMLNNGKNYYTTDSFLKLERKQTMVYGYSAVEQAEIQDGVYLEYIDFILVDMVTLDVTILEKVKEPPCLPTASSLIIQILDVYGNVYGFNKWGKLHIQKNGTWKEMSV